MSSYSEGQIHQLAEALEAAGYKPADITALGQNAREYLGLIRVTHRILCAVPGRLPIIRGSSIKCPGWVVEHLTPELEVLSIRSPGKVELWSGPYQMRHLNRPTGHEVYAKIKEEGLLDRSISFGNLKWYAQNPDRVPTEFRTNSVYGWASVVRSIDGKFYVPYLGCYIVPRPVKWSCLDDRLPCSIHAGLRAR